MIQHDCELLYRALAGCRGGGGQAAARLAARRAAQRARAHAGVQQGLGPPGAAQEDQAATQAAAYGRLTSVCNFVHMLQCDMAGSKASRWEM